MSEQDARSFAFQVSLGRCLRLSRGLHQCMHTLECAAAHFVIDICQLEAHSYGIPEVAMFLFVFKALSS